MRTSLSPRRAYLTFALLTLCTLMFVEQAAIAQVTRPKNPPTPESQRVNFQRKALPMIPPGTRFAAQPPKGWSNLIQFVRGKLSSGDVQSVSDTVRYYAEIFNLVMLANADKNADDKYELDKVAIGFSMRIRGINVVVTSDTQADLGGDLSLIGRSVLDGNIDSLKNVQQVARTTNSIVIDAPAIMLRSGKHRKMVVRYYIWVFPENGNIGTLVWLLDPSSNQSRLKLAGTTVQLLPANMQENREMNVDEDQFNLLGIPSKEAFALVRIPQGVAFEMSEKMQSVAAQKNYTAESLAKLTAAVARTLKTGKK